MAGMTSMHPPDGSARWAGLTLDRPRIMGILNVTPDSFSDGGSRATPDDAIAAGMAMAEDGAEILDVGGESTRPGADLVPPEVEQDRVVPVIKALAAAGLRVSVDTRNADTMRAALAAGAQIVNDVSALTHDPRSLAVVAEHRCPVVLMHMRGTPATMMDEAKYQDVVSEVRTELLEHVQRAIRGGVGPEQIVIDPGIGFAKHTPHSLALLRGLPRLADLGYPLLIGISRKAIIGNLSGEPQAARRLGGSLAAGLFAVLRGASILRVHDVRATVQAVRVWHTLFDMRHGSASPTPGVALEVPNAAMD